MKYTIRILLWVSLIATPWACSDSSENVDEEITAVDIANIGSIDETTTNFLDVITITNDMFEDMDANGRTYACYGIEETQNENELVITFEKGCIGEDGKGRSGSLILNWTGTIFSNEFSYTLTFDGYEVDGYALEGSITTSDWEIGQSSISFSVIVNDGMLTCPDGGELSYEQDLAYEFYYEGTTELTVDGSITGTNKDGISYVATVQDPITIAVDCEHPVSGSFVASFNDRPAVTVDYGDGTCDDQVTLSRGSESITITLD